MTPRSSPDGKHTWTDDAITRKLDELTSLCTTNEKPGFFPQSMKEFCSWTDESKRLMPFTRPVLYKQQNDKLRMKAQDLMHACRQRWSAAVGNNRSGVTELESLTKMLASRYQQERQLRLDAQREAKALRASVDSLSAKLRELTGTRHIKLVKQES